MEFFNTELQQDYSRVISQIENDPFSSQSTLGIFEVIRAHYLIADFFISEQRELGGIGPKDIKLLESALYRPWVEFGGTAKWPDPFDKAATTLFGLIKDTPFMMQISGLLCFRYYFCSLNKGACQNAQRMILKTSPWKSLRWRL